MNKINYIKSSVIFFPQEDIDTDQIIPARFLKATDRKGFGEKLFYDWRYDAEGKRKPTHPLNQDNSRVKILLAGKNFGCGSSREHAAWAIKDYGFDVVIAPYFADIFKGNALNNGVVPVEVSEEFYQDLTEELTIDPDTKVEVNLEKQEVLMVISGIREKFEISPYKKECLLNGLDDLDYLIEMREEIEECLLVERI